MTEKIFCKTCHKTHRISYQAVCPYSKEVIEVKQKTSRMYICPSANICHHRCEHKSEHSWTDGCEKVMGFNAEYNTCPMKCILAKKYFKKKG